MNQETTIIDPSEETALEDSQERVWSPIPDWVAIKAPSPGGITSFSKFSINYFETGIMTKVSPIGKSQAKCLIVHFNNGNSTGIPTLDPDALHTKVLTLIEEEFNEVETLGKALRLAAGELLTYKDTDKHPRDVYNSLVEAAEK